MPRSAYLGELPAVATNSSAKCMPPWCFGCWPVMMMPCRFKDRQRIESDKHYEVRTENNLCILQINGTDYDDSGAYMCRAVNDAGSSTTEARVRVQSELHFCDVEWICFCSFFHSFAYLPHPIPTPLPTPPAFWLLDVGEEEGVVALFSYVRCFVLGSLQCCLLLSKVSVVGSHVVASFFFHWSDLQVHFTVISRRPVSDWISGDGVFHYIVLYSIFFIEMHAYVIGIKC